MQKSVEYQLEVGPKIRNVGANVLCTTLAGREEVNRGPARTVNHT